MIKTLRSLAFICSVFCTAQVAANDVAPDFTLKSNGGENLRLEEQRGNVVMLNFWATWCAPCRKEMPVLEQIHQRYSAAGFVLWGVNVEQDSAAAAAMAKDLGVSFPIVFDPESKASQAYGIDAMPTTILIDRDGNIRYKHRGLPKGYEEKYRTQVRELLAE
ncbi:TlpA family protein disulfide reductase [Gilvimarinus agarilyticus]|uniref:TlpA family protein disulfide reductase n=1 Tax=unclassified Gilvimarinus TaxID=2642066 RepID=UPI001C0A5FAD|nr:MULTISPECIES: TlpA disulfide reductase family protein [unclassified Gilvimarinus]MBU2886299.1 TlpA family protein disulfide reductase [Gilvimarinus agarilyticus]MDO6570985.1 TlpA disulfide reductase family protein [Gilvimarinus sp. 2_MG-2023]MDO6747840.1 TlpA disulfide reductase family protein [Gilvimarinus sp. 1_MG-2023]